MRRALLISLLGLFVVAIGATPAKAALTIEEFETDEHHLGSRRASGPPHPHQAGHRRGAEVAKNITFDAPRGLFGNPGMLTQCTSLDFALQQCASERSGRLHRPPLRYEEIEGNRI